MNMNHALAMTFGLFAMTAAATADSVQMTADGLGVFSLDSGTINVLADNGPKIRGSELSAIHDALHGDGISTDGLVTVLFAETSQGLTMLTLVDDNTVGGNNVGDSSLGFSSSIDSQTAELYVNDVNQDVSSMTGDSVEGTFLWSSTTNGDGFAWANMSATDSWSVDLANLSSPGMDEGIQFLTWTGSNWDVLANAALSSNFAYSSFTSTTVPVPAAFGLGAAGLIGVAARRRRKTA